MKLMRRLFPYLFIAMIALALICYPSDACAGAVNGLRMCGSAVIPALFPFFVLSRLAISLGRLPQGGKRTDALMQHLFGVSGACLPALLVSFIGGYPIGVSTIASMYENGTLSKRDAERAITFCNNSGPAFFVGIVGMVVLGNVQNGLILYGLHCIAALLTGILTARPQAANWRLRAIKVKSDEPPSFAQSFLNAVSGSCAALLQISALVVFFSILLRLLRTTGVLSLLCLPLCKILKLTIQEAEAILCGCMELSSGILQLSGVGNSAFVLCAGLLGWGGMCVHFQAMSLWQPAGLQPHGYFSGKLLHSLISILLASAYLYRTPIAFGIAASILLISIFFARFCKKKASNPRKIAV